MFTGLHCFVRTASDPAEVKRVPARKYLAVRNQAKLTIERSRHRAVREMAAKSRRQPPKRLVTLHKFDVHGHPARSRRPRRYRPYRCSRALLGLGHCCVDRGDVTAAAFWNQQQQQRRGSEKDQVD